MPIEHSVDGVLMKYKMRLERRSAKMKSIVLPEQKGIFLVNRQWEKKRRWLER